MVAYCVMGIITKEMNEKEQDCPEQDLVFRLKLQANPALTQIYKSHSNQGGL